MADQQVVMIRGPNLGNSILGEAMVEDLKASLQGPLFCPSEAGYDDARKIWNGMIDRRPALIACCRGVADIINSVNFVRTHGLLVAVRGGGHNVAGNAVCDGGLMIDLSGMRSVRVDPVQRTARAESGATWGEFDHETQVFGLATTGGQISTTGVARLTLGGGWGHLARQFGLASDNLISADLVTADGNFLTVSGTQHSDLFWGLRGGGGNFGVVTSLEYRLHPVGPMLAGIVAYPFEKAKDALRLFRDLTAEAPDELASDIVLITMPDGTPVVGMVVCYNGPHEDGERILRPLKSLSPLLLDGIGPMPYTAAQKLVDDFYPKGLQNYWKSSFIAEISDAVIDTIVHYCASRPSPMCHGLIEYQLGGAVI
jgi:FAD/FMN-containing dehydrogenase